jgi:PAS domain S-box-containing protein
LSGAVEQITGYSMDEIKERLCWRYLVIDEDLPVFDKNVTGLLPGDSASSELRIRNKTGGVVWLHTFTECVMEKNDPVSHRIYGACRDITERKRIAKDLQRSEESYRLLFDSIDEGFCIIEVIFDENEKPIDYRFLKINPSFEKQTGLIDAQGKRMRELAPKHEEHWFEIYGKIAVTGQPARFVNRAEQLHRWYDVYAFRIGQPENRQVAILFNDITERKRVERELVSAQESLKDAHRLAHIGTWEWVMENDAVTWSEELYHIAGRDISLPAPTYAEHPHFYTPSSWERLDSAVTRTLTTGEPYQLELELIRPDGTIRWILAFGGVKRDGEGKVIGLHGTLQDITGRMQAEQELQNSFSFLNSLIDQSAQSMWISDEKGTLIRLNPACCDLMKITAADVIGKYNLFSDNLILEQGFLPMVRDVFLKGQPANFQITYDTQNLKNLELDRCVSVILDVTIFPVKDSSGKVTNAVIQHTNITGRKQAEEKILALNRDLEKRVEERTGQLNKSLHEKEVLLKEVHHRVKNNLQIVASLLSLQSRYIKDERVLDMLKESQNRVKTMALVHERLYRSEDIAHIDLADYIRFLATNLFNSYNISPRKIRLTIDIKDIGVDINSAIPVGLIINELVSNSLKSAFPGEAKGEIIISGHKSADSINIQVKDTGIGMPEGLDWKNAESLGLRLVISLVEQLQGIIELEKGPGTVFRLTLHEKT